MAQQPLQAGIEAVRAGDYVLGRKILRSDAVPADDRDKAERIARSTQLDPGTLLAGLGCVALLLLVIAIAAFKQP